jgi:phosphoserine aminotransferase
MKRALNFSSGPAALPEEVLQQVASEMLDWQGSGMSVMEMSHRGEHFMRIHAQAQHDLRELMGIPAHYRVLFLQGGATLQFTIVPMNLMGLTGAADYITTGEWSRKALREARRYGRAHEAASDEANGFRTIPPPSAWKRSADAGYLHLCSNETIGGVEFHALPDTGTVPLVADMSSTILSRPIDVSRYGLIYAGAQKNIGPAGLTIVIVREDLLGHALPGTPALLDLAAQAEADSMINTPSTFSIYVAGLVFQWLKRQGGVAAIEQRNIAKAKLLYDCIDASKLFVNRIDPAVRSRMNITFQLARPELDHAFLEGAEREGMQQLKGHRTAGGMRASIYNAMTIESIQTLANYMRRFEAQHA